jgi:hypothetical protein
MRLASLEDAVCNVTRSSLIYQAFRPAVMPETSKAISKMTAGKGVEMWLRAGWHFSQMV